MEHTAGFWIGKLGLTKHVEGGAFREIYRSQLELAKGALTPQHHGNRAAMTSIYYLLEHGDFSAFHRIASDELWHFYDGACLCIYEITPGGQLLKHKLGRDIAAGEALMVAIPAGSWFGSRVEIENGFTLCGCTVAPGFDFADFEIAGRVALTETYPGYFAIIAELTRQ